MTNPRIEAARGLLHAGVSYSSENPDFQDIVLAARALPFALDLAAAAWNVRAFGDSSRDELDAALEAFLKVLPDA